MFEDNKRISFKVKKGRLELKNKEIKSNYEEFAVSYLVI